MEIAQSLGLIRRSYQNENELNFFDHSQSKEEETRKREKKQKNLETRFFDLFRSRVIFPILTLRGQVAGFGGRSLKNEHPKYLNSPESLIFQKSKLLFGLYQAQKFIRELDQVILVEGYFDALALYSVGIRNVVATCGTTLSSDHLLMIRRLASKVILLFDGDEAGIGAMERSMELGLEKGLMFYGVSAPAGLDPDEWVKKTHGVEELKEKLQTSSPLLDQKIESVLQKVTGSDIEVKVQSLKQVASWLKKLKDPVSVDVRVEDLEKKLGLSKKVIMEAIQKASFSSSKEREESSKPKNIPNFGSSFKTSNDQTSKGIQKIKEEVNPLQKISHLDQVIVAGLFQNLEHRECFQEYSSRLPTGKKGIHFFESLRLQVWAEKYLSPSLFEAWNLLPSETFLENIDGDDTELKQLIIENLMGRKEPIGLIDFKMALHKMLMRLWLRISEELKKAIQRSETQNHLESQASLMREYLDVQKKIKEFKHLL